MSTEHIVNRITSPFQEIEAAKLGPSAAEELESIFKKPIGVTVIEHREDSDTVQHILPSAEDLDTVVAESEDNIGNVITEPVIQDWSGGPGHVSTAEVVALVLKKQLEFEAKVTAAFKHLGLDTRRFFGV